MSEDLQKSLLTAEVTSEIKADIDNAFATVLNRSWKHWIISRQSRFLSIACLIIGVLLIVAGIASIIISSEPGHVATISSLPIIISGAILMTFGVTFSFLRNIYSQKIRNLLNLDLIKYWKLISKESQKWKFTALENNFTLPITEEFMKTLKHSILRNSDCSYQRWVERVLVGSSGKNIFNVGSIIEKIVERDYEGKNETVTYNRYLYYVQSINNEFQTKIMPENFMTRIKEKFKKNIKLESAEFEKIFAVDYQNPIELRKLLSPKVMGRMIDLAKNHKIPTIELDINRIALMKYYNNVNINSNRGTICCLSTGTSAETCYNNIVKMLATDLLTIQKFAAWVDAFDFQ